jgi:tetratricopeptide (TPR) repeat protein
MVGLTLTRVGQVDEAIAAHREAIRLKPDVAGWHFNLGSALSRKWELEQQGPNATTSSPSQQGVTAGKGQLNEAVAAFAEAVRLKPDYIDAIRSLASALEKNGGPEEIRAKYQSTFERYRKTVAYFLLTAGAHWQNDRYQQAIANYKEALAINPDSPEANNLLGWMLLSADDLSLRDPQQALWHAEQAVAKAVDKARTPLYLNTLGVAYYRIGKSKEAIETLNQVAKRRTNHFDTYLFLAMAHWELGNKEEARTWYDKGVEWFQSQESSLPEYFKKEFRRWRAEAAQLMGLEKANINDDRQR